MDKVRISIVVPVYNAEDYLDRCLHSVMDQEFTSYEVILVDDGSTDASSLICDRYSSTDPRFVTIHQANKGVSAARNAGINMAQGEYVMFLDSDDVLLPFALETMMENVAGEDVVVGGYGVFIGKVPGKEVLPPVTKSYKEDEYPVFFDDNITHNCELLDSPWAKLFRTKMIRRIRFDEELNYAEDKLFVFDVLSKCKSILAVSHAVYGYYMRPGSLGSDISSDQHIEKLMKFIPKYIPVISALNERCPSVPKVKYLYHNDVVGRYLCRILNIFTTRKSSMLTEENLAWVYSLMDEDKDLGVFSLRAGQIPNLLLYKIKNINFSIKTYKFFVKVYSIFKRK